MKISMRGNTILIALPRGEVEQIGVEQDGHVIDEFVMSGRVFDRILKVQVSVDKVKAAPFTVEERMEAQLIADEDMDYEPDPTHSS